MAKKEEKKGKKEIVKAGKKQGKETVKDGKKEKSVKKREEEIAIADLAGAFEESIRLFTCEECGMVVSVAEECRCEECNLVCCGKSMVESFSLVGNTYRCEKCGLKVMVENDCKCEDPCDLSCCGNKMALCYDI